MLNFDLISHEGDRLSSIQPRFQGDPFINLSAGRKFPNSAARAASSARQR
jgi:hypothetical protein